ncbi:MAG: hypothetical protein QOG63_2049 [Thermoleophilaceae bacterium]|jgi:hypothetical protein|nr:hypothetical protein [Thermoleophilaceae bacterium]
MQKQIERRSPESQAARALVAAHRQAEEARRKLELLQGPHPPAVVRRRRRYFAERLAQAQEEERRLLESFGGSRKLTT